MANNVFAVSRTYSLTTAHINKVIEMAFYSGKSQGEIVRESIDLLYSKKMLSNDLVVCGRHTTNKVQPGKFQK